MPNPFVANTAFEGLFEVSSWIQVDPAGNPQGLTISEYRAVSGPMNGLCPPSPSKIYPDMESTTGGVAVDNTNTVYWNAAKNVPGVLTDINYYSVDVLRPALGLTGVAGESIEIAGAIVPASVLSAQLPVNLTLVAGDELLVRAWKDYPAVGVDALGKAARVTVTDASSLAAGTVIEDNHI